jgi:hypothetical protein
VAFNVATPLQIIRHTKPTYKAVTTLQTFAYSDDVPRMVMGHYSNVLHMVMGHYSNKLPAAFFQPLEGCGDSVNYLIYNTHVTVNARPLASPLRGLAR